MGQSVIYRFDQFTIDTGQFQLSRDDASVRLEPLAFDLLVYLIEHRDRVVGRDELLDKLWPGKVVTDAALAARLRDLRKALGDSGRRQAIIKTVHGRGYRFIHALDEPVAVTQTSWVDPIISGEEIELPAKPSLAVLPFKNDGHDIEDDYFSDGVTDGVINGLTRFRDLFVIGRSSAFACRQQPDDIGEIGRKLGVRYLVQGAVRRRDRQVRISVDLIDAVTGQNLWSEHYDRRLEDLFAVEDEVTRVITSTLAGEIEVAALQATQNRAPENLAAYDWVLRGNRAFELGTKDDLLEARRLYDKAVELDPNCAAAFIGLSKVCIYLHWGYLREDHGRILRQSLDFGQKAVMLDERDSRAHYAVGSAYFHLGRLDLAEYHVEKALALNPGEYHHQCFKAYLLACTGRHEESTACFMESLRRNPLAPNSCLYGLGISDYLAHRYDEAVAMLTRLSSDLLRKFSCLAAAEAQLGHIAEAEAAVREFHALLEPELVATLGDDVAKWRENWSNLFSILNPDDFEHMLEGLRKAGLPA